MSVGRSCQLLLLFPDLVAFLIFIVVILYSVIILGDAKIFSPLQYVCTKEKNRSGSTSVVVIDKSTGYFREMKTIGVSFDPKEIEQFC